VIILQCNKSVSSQRQFIISTLASHRHRSSQPAQSTKPLLKKKQINIKLEANCRRAARIFRVLRLPSASGKKKRTREIGTNRQRTFFLDATSAKRNFCLEGASSDSKLSYRSLGATEVCLFRPLFTLGSTTDTQKFLSGSLLFTDPCWYHTSVHFQIYNCLLELALILVLVVASVPCRSYPPTITTPPHNKTLCRPTSQASQLVTQLPWCDAVFIHLHLSTLNSQSNCTEQCSPN
jgi:hypothetical protein